MTTAAEILDYLEGQGHALRLAGAPRAKAATVEVRSVEIDATAGGGALAWSKHAGAAAAFGGALLLCTEGAAAEPLAETRPAAGATSVVAVCDRPRLALAEAVWRFFSHLVTDEPPEYGSRELAEQAEQLGAWVRNASVAAGVRLGVHCSIGCAGMGYERRSDGRLVGFPQMGRVTIETDVDIAAHATIQRGAIGQTRVRRGAKIGPHVNVGHNVDVGADVLIAGHAQIGGGARIGDRAVLWQSCAIANGVTVGEGAVIGMGAQVLKDVPPGETWVGNPAHPLRPR